MVFIDLHPFNGREYLAAEKDEERQTQNPGVITGKRCRHTAEIAMRAFIDLMREVAVDGRVSLDEVYRIGAAVMAAEGPLTSYYARCESSCERTFAMATIEKQRTDFFGRLLVWPFEHLLSQPGSGIERKNLAQFFAAIRMILGEEVHEELRTRCTLIVECHRNGEGLIDWPGYFEDPESHYILEQILVTVARSFRRWEPRKDWFLIVMNSNPASLSLGSSAFVPRRPEDKMTHSFTEAHACHLLEALFARMRPEDFDDERRETFRQRWGSDPEKIFGPLLVELKRLSLSLQG